MADQSNRVDIFPSAPGFAVSWFRFYCGWVTLDGSGRAVLAGSGSYQFGVKRG
jgi:hypothetical protein